MADWFFWVERQTLRRLPRSGAVLFTIRTYVNTLAEVLAADERAGANLLHALNEAPEALKGYKGWVGVADALRVHLSHRE